ncbi:arsinothricin resistance N-acetyltransferase ArsN1 family A [Neobacillus terrae]|uniref:arsinothricin resistance N-acetyltransferase ArsN1 family A n=1 Tax=Neobacillus terrae TaxID=3034837 RepID=UPI00140816EE|nr:arsinothricin resistance N-acetyltransferase ArsN1 family A [Neobacillus terrae]NHM32023.1 N-acetyltransferase [Neobacillus terrae]
MIKIENAQYDHLEAILSIYNQGIQDRIATLETDEKDFDYIKGWFLGRGERYSVLVAKEENEVVGWASLNLYSHRCAYSSVADLSVYIKRGDRGKGIGKILLKGIEQAAKEQSFHKIILFTFPFNLAGQKLYHKMGYREVGVFQEQGEMDGKRVDVMAMEKLLEV